MHANNRDNCIYGSWIFHQYFDSLNTVNKYPEIAVKFDRAEEPAMVDLGHRHEMRTKINVTIEFIDEDVANLVSHYLKNGTEAISGDLLKYRSWLYARDAAMMEMFLKDKYEKTKEQWAAFLEEE